MKNWNRYLLGGLFGMTAEYLYRVNVNTWAILSLICIGLLIVIDIVKTWRS
jgi:hypothetical protein